MKATIFARPNLKVFLVGALLIMVIQHLINDGFSQGSASAAVVSPDAERANAVERIVSQAGMVRPSQIYAQLSDFYEERGDLRRALRYLRLANSLADAEGETE